MPKSIAPLLVDGSERQMKSFGGRRLPIVILGMIVVGFLAVKLISSGGLGSIGLGIHLLGDSFATAESDLKMKGFQYGELQNSDDQPPVVALACDRVNARGTRAEDQIFRVEMAGSGDKITRVTTRPCGSAVRPCSKLQPSLSNNQVAPMSIPRPSQPPPLSMTTAFAIFCVIMTTAWCADWRHYIRFWLGQHPNYQGRWAFGFRIFFAISLLSALQMVIRTAFSHSWTLQDCKYTAFWVVVLTATAAALDGIFRFTMGRPKVFSNGVSQS